MPTYVINLDSARDRMNFMTEQLDSQNIRFTRFPAVDGRTMTPSETRKVTTRACGMTCTASMVGCGMSHRAVWRDMLHQGMEAALVLEDDAVLCPNFQGRLAEAMAVVPADFDILVLGCLFLCNVKREYPWMLDVMGAFVSRRDDPWTATNGSTTVYVPERFAGTHAYVISAKGAAKLLHLLDKISFHVDVEMNHPSVRLYAASPDLATQRDMLTSSIASFDFPEVLMPWLEHRDRNGICIAYYASVPWGQVGGVVINAWFAIFFMVGLLAPQFAWTGVAGFFLAEIVAKRGVVSGVMPHLAAYILGVAFRTYGSAFFKS